MLKDKAVIQAGWDDAPWIDANMKREMWESTPVHLREARSKGIPTIGSGNVYSSPLSDIVIEGFPIPGHWKWVWGMDVGWNLTAICYLAIDPLTDTTYVVDEYYQGKVDPIFHAQHVKDFEKKRGFRVPGAIDPASRGRSQVDGRKLIDIYQREHGLLLVPAINAVESGTKEVETGFVTGKIKIFRHCINFQKEYVGYRRDLEGKIVKAKDHEMDAFRYGYIMRNIARAAPTTNGVGYGGTRYF